MNHLLLKAEIPITHINQTFIYKHMSNKKYLQ